TTTPSPPKGWLVRITKPLTGPITVTGSPGSVEPNATVTVLDARTGASVTAPSDASGGFSVNLLAAIGDDVSVTVIDAAGSVGPSTILTVGPMTISISTPTDGSMVDGDRVVVQGTFVGDANTSVAVNGLQALAGGGTFTAVNVPLSSGDNVLTAVVS